MFMRAFVSAVCLSLLVTASGSFLAMADPDLPPAIVQAVDEAKTSCDAGVARLNPGFLTKKDVNGDGIPDFILDYGRVMCGESIGTFCGTAGCLTEVYVSTADGTFLKVLNENVRDLQFRKIKGRSAMLIGLHGSACGRIGAEPCGVTLYWNGTKFSPAN